VNIGKKALKSRKKGKKMMWNCKLCNKKINLSHKGYDYYDKDTQIISRICLKCWEKTGKWQKKVQENTSFA